MMESIVDEIEKEITLTYISISLIEENTVAHSANYNIPWKYTSGRSHQVRNNFVGGEDISSSRSCEVLNIRIFGGGDRIEILLGGLLQWF